MGNNCWGDEWRKYQIDKEIVVDRSKQISGPTILICRPTITNLDGKDSFVDTVECLKEIKRDESTQSTITQPDNEVGPTFIKQQTRVVKQGKKIRK